MQIKLRSKQGGRIEVLDENGQPIEGVIGVELVARAPDFVPRVSVLQHLAITADVDAEMTFTAAEKGKEKLTEPITEEAKTVPVNPNPHGFLRK